MSFLMEKSKNQTNEEIKNPLTHRYPFHKNILIKCLYDFNYPNITSKYKESKKLSSKCNILRNSRK